MKAKEKNKRKNKLSLKRIIIFFVGIIVFLYLIILYNYFLNKSEVLAKETGAEIGSNVKISNANEINLDEVINENNKQDSSKEEFITEEIDLEYITKYQSNSELPKGVIQVVQEGREGKQEVTIKRTYENGQVLKEEQVNSKIIKSAINKIVEVGSGTGSAYKVKVGDKVYITSDRAEIKLEPNVESKKIATFGKDTELTILEINGDWYKIEALGSIGYIKKENVTYRNEEKEDISQNNNSSGTNITKLSFDMALNKPSGLSLEQFKKVLTDSKDVNKVMQNNAEYFYYIEEQYNINGLFVAAVAIHESGWGTSKISKDKYNLFGYGAYDSNPYNGAYEFSDYSESIDLIARVFVKYYLNPKGTSIYGGEQASGKYYNGPTLTGVNTKYATDKNWANAVYKHMEYLYNKL